MDLAADGRLLLSGGGDKELHVTCLKSRQCVVKACGPKKICSGVFDKKGRRACCGDKFGDAFAVDVPDDGPPASSVRELPPPIFGHVCSAVTQLAVLGSNR